MIKKKIVMLFSSFLVGLMLIASGTSALFTSQDTNANPFTSGTVILELSGFDQQTNHYFDVGNMAPGDTEEREVTVTNTGTLNMRFNITHEWDVAGGTLGDALTVSYFKYDGLDGNNNEIWTAISQPENANFELASGDSQLIKVEVHLPIGTGNAYQGDTAILNILASGEQTKNNPLQTTITWGENPITYHEGYVGTGSWEHSFDDASMNFSTLNGISSVDFTGSGYALGHHHYYGNQAFSIQVFDVDANQWVDIWSNGTIYEQVLDELGVVNFPSVMNINGIRFNGEVVGYVWHDMNQLQISFQ
ncbi:TasA family protein [Lottiidibacillus patelloidae]|uniref:TasA family protein n=1 Tax=Lottiidibacillus patelloidae TaxID=2670334 RepID=UPI0013032DB6|nr:TasA family protein [Lottiidibacillus patelloidae]